MISLKWLVVLVMLALLVGAFMGIALFCFAVTALLPKAKAPVPVTPPSKPEIDFFFERGRDEYEKCMAAARRKDMEAFVRHRDAAIICHRRFRKEAGLKEDE